MDEMWSYIGNKRRQCWLWLAQDDETGLIVGCAVGPRTDETAQKLWDSMPENLKKNADFFTDGWGSYEKVLPPERHWVVDKASGIMNKIERLNNTFRQRLSRLVRKTLAFSKSFEIHEGLIWNFVHYYNQALLN